MDLKTTLNDRELRFDGVSIYTPDTIATAIIRGVSPKNLRVTELTSEILAFNSEVSPDEQLRLQTVEPMNLSMAWQIPAEFANLDLNDYIASKLPEVLKNYEDPEPVLNRVAAELLEVQRRGMVQFMKTIIYILDVFRASGVVWGVGRGSSCASYLLYVLGLHAVDCMKFEVPMEEFFHD